MVERIRTDGTRSVVTMGDRQQLTIQRIYEALDWPSSPKRPDGSYPRGSGEGGRRNRANV